MKKTGLYIHIPFCVSKCDYCDFLSFGGMTEGVMNDYVNALCQEIKNLSVDTGIKELLTIYIGGGTPSLLNEKMFCRLMETVEASFVLRGVKEFTIEVNPGTVDASMINVYTKHGVNRVSMGLQSDDDATLKAIGRIHDYKTFENTYGLLMEHGILNVSVDVMFGLPEQSFEGWQGTLERVIALEPKHISAYSLIIEEGTVFEEKYDNGTLVLPDEAVERNMYWYAHKRLLEAGYHHYEISNYAERGFEAIHNSSYWDMTPYIGVGLGASSYYNGIRYKNLEDLQDYIKASGDLESIRQIEQVNDEVTTVEELFFLGLRQLDGVNLEKIASSYGHDAVSRYYDVIDDLIHEGLLVSEGLLFINHKNSLKPMAKIIKLSSRGIDISNHVMARFLI